MSNEKPTVLADNIKSIEVCVKELKEIGLSDEEIKKLDQVLDSIIDNRLDFTINKLNKCAINSNNKKV